MRRRVLALAAVATASVAAAPVAHATLARAPVFRDAYGIHVISQKSLDSRLLALSVSTSALPAPANVRILLPSGYAAHPHRRYPVLYLLHGTSGGAADWTTMGDAEQTTAGLGMIVVMPDIALNDDGGGWCTNWYNGGAYGQPEWETFHIDQLIPWIDHDLRTVATRDGRAIAGLSQGGFCSMSYAARHPDLFETALAYSGAPDIAYDTEAQTLVTPIINATEVALDGVPIDSMFGPRTSEEINWAAHDPTTLANNLRGMNLFMYTGNGVPGPLDSGLPNGEANVIESGVQQLTILFHNHLQSLGIPSVLDDYGAGTHSWPYWARDLRWSIAAIMSDFKHPLPAPKTITYMSADSSYSVFGWWVVMHRDVEEFSTLKNASHSGFTLQGSGSATVKTPADYRPGRRFKVTAGSTTLVERAGRYGRLTIQVPLGPSNTVQEYPLDGSPAGTNVYTTNVSIVRAGR
jgi:S-formylglutathione hydrolase FrmB